MALKLMFEVGVMKWYSNLKADVQKINVEVSNVPIAVN